MGWVASALTVGWVVVGGAVLCAALEAWAWLRRSPRVLPLPADEVDTEEVAAADAAGWGVGACGVASWLDVDYGCRLGACLDHECCRRGGSCEQVAAALNVTLPLPRLPREDRR